MQIHLVVPPAALDMLDTRAKDIGDSRSGIVTQAIEAMPDTWDREPAPARPGQRVCIYLPTATLDKLRQQATGRHLSLAAIIRRAIAYALTG